jgi:hypothetical protein
MQERYSEGASASELLFLLEDMRRELTRSIVPVDHTKAPVSVWLPQGYVGPQFDPAKEKKGDVTANIPTGIISPNEEMGLSLLPTDIVNAQVPDFEMLENLAKEEKVNLEEKVVQENKTMSFMGVPRPPLVRVFEAEVEDELPSASDVDGTLLESILDIKNELKEEETVLIPEVAEIFEIKKEVIQDGPLSISEVTLGIENDSVAELYEPVTLIIDDLETIQEIPVMVAEKSLTVVLEEKEAKEEIAPNEVEKVQEAETPVVFELDLQQWETEPIPQKWEPLNIPDGFLVGSGFKENLVAQRPRELHEILANRVLAKPQGNNPGDTGMGVMEKISGGKIIDLKKGFSINDRFRFINSLFRGDEAMFDRAIKTINNFGILPEAQYWMQRELVIKLGWNDEDELVQHFYQLVTRRFL